MKRAQLCTVMGAMAGGALATLLLDPHSGRRRRALLADKAAHYRHAAPRWATGTVRGAIGPLHGVTHALRRRLPGFHAAPPPDEETFIKQRVETDLGRERHRWPESVTFEAIDGIVRIRGTAPDADTAARLVQRVAEIDGVRAAESLMALADGSPVEAVAGDKKLVAGPPRAVVLGEQGRERILARWLVAQEKEHTHGVSIASIIG